MTKLCHEIKYDGDGVEKQCSTGNLAGSGGILSCHNGGGMCY